MVKASRAKLTAIMAEIHCLLYRASLGQARAKVTVNMSQKIEKAGWPTFLDFLSKALIGNPAEIELSLLQSNNPANLRARNVEELHLG